MILAAMTACAQQLFVGTYNVRYNNSDDAAEGNGWQRRSKVLCDQINFEHPDIFGTQEVLHGQLEDMRRLLDAYDYIGVGRDDGKEAGEYSAIFYDTRVLRLLDQGHFWLSETPGKPGLGWDAACTRICTWGKFKDLRTKKTFFFFDLHMDHVGVVARREGARLVISRVKEIAKGQPVILTGDFNVDQNDETYQIFAQSGLLKDCYANARLRFAENGTFNNFNASRLTRSRIDHVFVSPNIKVDRYGILTNGYWTADDPATANREIIENATRRTPSDHYPVFVHLYL